MPPAFKILIFSPECLPFSIALTVMFGIALLEIAGLLMGIGSSAALDSGLPDTAIELTVEPPSALDALFGFLHAGKVPTLILLISLLTGFGLGGLTLQWLAASLLGGFVSPWLASAFALLLALPFTHLTNGLFIRILPSEETSALSRANLIGCVATLLQTSASYGSPAQAKLRDKFGQTHYVLVEPEDAGAVLAAGEEILLVRDAGARFTAIRNDHAALSRRDPAN